MSDSQSTVIENLRVKVATFPRLPGVYVMRNPNGEVLYIGKAKDLRARVRTYLVGGDGRAQIEFLLKKIFDIETVVTENEQQAFILERDLITKHKPPYNIRLKDDKAYLSVRIDPDVEWPRIEIVRKVEQDGARYFGPYVFSHELRTLLDIIKRVLPLRTCTNTVFFNRQRPCLEYQIKRCSGPCCLPVDRMQYGLWIKQAMALLEGKTEGLIKDLQVQMERASEDLRFEDAALMRDRLETIKNFTRGQSIISTHGEDRDIFALYREERLCALSVLQVRRGRIAGSINFNFSDVEISDEEVVESSLSQFYESGRDVPEEIVLPMLLQNESILRDALSRRRGAALEVVVPQRGLKLRLLKLAEINARQHFVSVYDRETRSMELAKELARLFKLKQVPRRIECVDISNFQGSDIVGAIVVFYDGLPDKSAYRKYKIEGRNTPDDFASIYEVVSRRLRRGLEEGNLPDLLLVDGGPGQLAMALRAREEIGVAIEIISIAKERVEAAANDKEISKKPERIYLEGIEEPIRLDPSSEITHLLARIRDEVHRFVITFHRSRRAKRVFSSSLDQIAGLGPERRRRLLKEFGNVAEIAKADPETVARIGRMPLPLAEKVLRKLKQ